jgi:hypothetical protein
VSKERERDRSIEGMLRATRRSTQPEAATPACLDAGVLASWVEASLAPEEAARVETHLASCVRCQALLAAFARAEPPASPVVPFWRRWAVLLPLAAATAAASLLWIAWPQRQVPAAPTATVAEAPRIAEVPQPPVPTPPASAAPQEPEKKEPSASAKSESKVSVRAQPAAAHTTAAQAGAADALDASKPVASPASASPVFRSAVPPPGAPVPLAVPPPPARQLPTTSGLSEARSAVVAESPLTTAEPIAIFQSPEAIGGVGAGGSAGAGAAGGRGGGGRPSAIREVANAASSVTRWRILPSHDLERSTDDGRTWERVAIDPPPLLTNGAAPSRLVCWLVGQAGVVLVTTDATHFTRLALPEPLDLSTVHAADALNATVTTADGRSFETTDGGKTWTPKRVPTA